WLARAGLGLRPVCVLRRGVPRSRGCRSRAGSEGCDPFVLPPRRGWCPVRRGVRRRSGGGRRGGPSRVLPRLRSAGSATSPVAVFRVRPLSAARPREDGGFVVVESARESPLGEVACERAKHSHGPVLQ